MSIQLTPKQRKAFEDIFLMEDSDKDGKIDVDGLRRIFSKIDYKIDEQQLQEIVSKLFFKKDLISFSDFLKIFTLKLTDYTMSDVKNSFRLLAKDDDKFIKYDVIKSILAENGMSELEIIFLTNQLLSFTDSNGNVNYQEFLKGFSLG